ncbi:hypothetical protein BDN72DRAFT_244854 [Pluteus cervinus]|uniref:Uncharacterized protein n=1 Tax=Pluteus cervinus TaxID=181527 RepID=A0ACD3BFQ2_9AGAR|nr:hypothetical protein BDN72DRAFT_244854 [Pluteus cervinus]
MTGDSKIPALQEALGLSLRDKEFQTLTKYIAQLLKPIDLTVLPSEDRARTNSIANKISQRFPTYFPRNDAWKRKILGEAVNKRIYNARHVMKVQQAKASKVTRPAKGARGVQRKQQRIRSISISVVRKTGRDPEEPPLASPVSNIQTRRTLARQVPAPDGSAGPSPRPNSRLTKVSVQRPPPEEDKIWEFLSNSEPRLEHLFPVLMNGGCDTFAQLQKASHLTKDDISEFVKRVDVFECMIPIDVFWLEHNIANLARKDL